MRSAQADQAGRNGWGAGLAVVFDVGGTLIHPDQDLLGGALERGCGTPAPHGALAALNLANAVREGFGQAHGAPELSSVLAVLLGLSPEPTARAMRETFADRSFYAHLDPDAEPTLQALSAAGLGVYALSNSDTPVQPLLRAHGIAVYFSEVLYSARLGHEKPDARAYAAVTSASGLSAESLCYVGDGLVNDVIGPLVHGAGRAILYDRFGLYGDLGRLEKVNRLGEVVPLLTRLVEHRNDRR